MRVFSCQGWCPSIPVLADEPVPAGVDYDMWLGPATKRPFNRNPDANANVETGSPIGDEQSMETMFTTLPARKFRRFNSFFSDITNGVPALVGCQKKIIWGLLQVIFLA